MTARPLAPSTLSFDAHAALGQRSSLIPAALPGRLADVLRLLGLEADANARSADVTVPLWHARSGATLFHEGARAAHLYVVRSGSFKCLKTSEDGYEQVLSFCSQGEVLGFEALCRGSEPVSAVALEDSTVFALPLRELDAWRQRWPALDRALQHALSAQLARACQTSEMMAAVAAEVRLARFLLWMSARAEERGQSPRRLLLRMNRREIASLLGVAHETVSRAFSALAEWGMVKVDNREIEILDPAGLRSCTRSTRRSADEPPRRALPLRALASRAPAEPAALAA